jgi:hypothetical protein
MKKDPFNIQLVFISPPVKTNTIDRGATRPCNYPEKDERDGVRNKIEKANENG